MREGNKRKTTMRKVGNEWGTMRKNTVVTINEKTRKPKISSPKTIQPHPSQRPKRLNSSRMHCRLDPSLSFPGSRSRSLPFSVLVEATECVPVWVRGIATGPTPERPGLEEREPPPSVDEDLGGEEGICEV